MIMYKNTDIKIYKSRYHQYINKQYTENKNYIGVVVAL